MENCDLYSIYCYDQYSSSSISADQKQTCSLQFESMWLIYYILKQN